MKLKLTDYEERLFTDLLDEGYVEKLLSLIKDLNDMGYTKRNIYGLFLDFHKEIQVDPRTKGDETIYDNLCDFMDGFTAWGKRWKILPHEPDVT